MSGCRIYTAPRELNAFSTTFRPMTAPFDGPCLQNADWGCRIPRKPLFCGALGPEHYGPHYGRRVPPGRIRGIGQPHPSQRLYAPEV